MNMTQNNNFSSLLLGLLGLFILIFFTKGFALSVYAKYQDKATLQVESLESRQQWEDFSALKKQLESGESDSDLNAYAQYFSQADFIDFLYGYLETTNSGWSSALIKTINFSEPEQNEIGFMQVNIDVSLRIPSLAILWDMLNYLVSDQAKYKIFITDFSFPNDNQDWNLIVDLPLKIFYK